jgi:plasmid stabilization system protein ParE
MGRQKTTASTAYEIRISTNALQNIDEITGYIAFVNQQPLNAIKVGDALYRVIDRIARNPFAFRECEELPTKTKMYRRALCYSWRIIYRIKTNKVLVLGTIHSSRRPSLVKPLRKVK